MNLHILNKLFSKLQLENFKLCKYYIGKHVGKGGFNGFKPPSPLYT